jgi:hypothetical protein
MAAQVSYIIVDSLILSILDARPWMSIPDTNSARSCLSILDNVFMSSYVSVSLTVPASVSFSIPDSACLCFNIPDSACPCFRIPDSACLCFIIPDSACLCFSIPDSACLYPGRRVRSNGASLPLDATRTKVSNASLKILYSELWFMID